MSEESSEPLAEPHEFRAQILAEYPDDFARFRDVLATLEPAIGSQESVQLSTELHRAMDMIMLQAYKSLCSVYVLLVRAHFEDAATICRRLMELAAQAGYIVEIEEDAEQNRRAGGYLASLWEAAPPQLKDALPADYRAAWEKYHRDHQHLLKGKWRTWRPSFKETALFEAPPRPKKRVSISGGHFTLHSQTTAVPEGLWQCERQRKV